MMQIKVYVRNQDGTPLMPCTPAKARKLLRAGRARVVERCPFTIQLVWQCEAHVQEVTLGIDKGSSVTGMACVGNGEVLLAAEIHHRLDVKEKLDTRRMHRRSRRNRKWYRPQRYLNRASSKRSGRLPPSIKTNVEEVIRVVKHIPLPIARIVIEDVQVDIARLNNPSLRGSQYQDPTRLDENLRIACLMRDGYRCQHCKKQGVRLEAHHIHFRKQGGKDTLANLLCLCEQCHAKVHAAKITLQVTGVSGHLDQIAQRAMQGKSFLYATLGQHFPLITVFGYETAIYRKYLELPKTHLIDAQCIATLSTGEVVPVPQANVYRIGFRPRQTRRQYHEAREYLLEKWQRKCSYCGKENVPLQVEHIQAKANGGSDRISNLCLACEPCNLAKGTQDIRVFLAKKPELLARILTQAKSPLKDAAAVNGTRWALSARLQALGLPIECATGGRTKFNRVSRNLPKTHWLDAACVGVSTSETLHLQGVIPLLITATGSGSRQMCNVNALGFPCSKPKGAKKVKGFQTGDMVRAVVPSGKKQGTYVGRVLVRASGSFDIRTASRRVEGISHRFCRPIHRCDGYGYQYGVGHSSPD